jgi:hypothetical protein
MSAELIERLRAATMRTDWNNIPDDACIPAIPLLREAADHIEALEAENARLVNERDKMELRLDLELDAYAKDHDMHVLRKRAEAAEAEREALRVALRAASLGLDDLMRTLYAPELYMPEHVKESHIRIAAGGAPLAYVADLQERAARALTQGGGDGKGDA